MSLLTYCFALLECMDRSLAKRTIRDTLDGIYNSDHTQSNNDYSKKKCVLPRQSLVWCRCGNFCSSLARGSSVGSLACLVFDDERLICFVRSLSHVWSVRRQTNLDRKVFARRECSERTNQASIVPYHTLVAFIESFPSRLL